MCADGGAVYGAFASKLGSDASKMGKKVAQSEAGRSAGRAAIKGASDAAVEDLSNRYFGEVPETNRTSHQVGRVREPPTSTKSSGTFSSQKPSIRREVDSDEEEYQFQMMLLHKNKAKAQHNKPSKLARFKPNINLKIHDKQSEPQPRALQRKKKVYKYILSRDPDWDSLPQALTLYNYKGEMNCDLEFRKGQVIQVMTRTDSQNDWWEGRIEDRVGIFPANYVQLL